MSQQILQQYMHVIKLLIIIWTVIFLFLFGLIPVIHHFHSNGGAQLGSLLVQERPVASFHYGRGMVMLKIVASTDLIISLEMITAFFGKSAVDHYRAV